MATIDIHLYETDHRDMVQSLRVLERLLLALNQAIGNCNLVGDVDVCFLTKLRGQKHYKHVNC